MINSDAGASYGLPRTRSARRTGKNNWFLFSLFVVTSVLHGSSRGVSIIRNNRRRWHFSRIFEIPARIGRFVDSSAHYYCSLWQSIVMFTDYHKNQLLSCRRLETTYSELPKRTNAQLINPFKLAVSWLCYAWLLTTVMCNSCYIISYAINRTNCKWNNLYFYSACKLIECHNPR